VHDQSKFLIIENRGLVFRQGEELHKNKGVKSKIKKNITRASLPPTPPFKVVLLIHKVRSATIAEGPVRDFSIFCARASYSPSFYPIQTPHTNLGAGPYLYKTSFFLVL
jgi:hypothetical protein